MKKILTLLLAVLMLMSLAACDSNTGSETTAPVETTVPNETTTPVETTPNETTAPQGEELFAFQAGDAAIIPGTAFDPSVLPATDNVYTIPSCAFEGTDNVYNYGTYEIIAYNEGNGEVVYSVYFIDANLTTPEGLAIGDDAAKVTQLYGEGTVNGSEITYQKGNTLLVIILDGDFVASIEYREAV